jgi:predicted RNase H-like HicB family nuclease
MSDDVQEGNISMTEHTFTAVYSQDGPLWIGFIEEVPGAMSQGATIEECQTNLREALELMLEVQREDLARELEGHEIHRESLVLA